MEHRFNLKPSGTSCILKVKRHTCRYCFYSCAAKIYSREITLFFLYFFCPLASISPPTPCVPQERLLKLFIYREEEVEGQDILFSVRFGKIILIMILLTKGRMWLLKMDLWKNSYPQKNICRRGMTTPPITPPPAAVATLFHPSAKEFIRFTNSIQEPTFVFSRPASLKFIIPDRKYHFTFPAGSIPATLRLLRRRWFGEGLISWAPAFFFFFL